MGYDFTFLRLKKRPNFFPFKLDKEFNLLQEIKKVLGPKEIAKHLSTEGGFRPNGKNDDGVFWYWCDTPDGGSLDIQLRPDRKAIAVDTHAHWRYVLELLIILQGVMNDLLVLDNQTMIIYNTEAYKSLIENKYSEVKST